MRYVLNFFFNGEEYYLPIEDRHILDAEDPEGKHKVIDVCDPFIGLEADRSVAQINRTMNWFIENELDISLAEDFLENVLDIDTEITY